MQRDDSGDLTWSGGEGHGRGSTEQMLYTGDRGLAWAQTVLHRVGHWVDPSSFSHGEARAPCRVPGAAQWAEHLSLPQAVPATPKSTSRGSGHQWKCFK